MSIKESLTALNITETITNNLLAGIQDLTDIREIQGYKKALVITSNTLYDLFCPDLLPRDLNKKEN